jgi:CRISPR-associated protein Cas1
LTQSLIAALLENNVALIFCDDTHHPAGLVLPLDVHHVQQERFSIQIEASVPMKKQLWQQTVEAKIRNQASLLQKIGCEPGKLVTLARIVKSGDPENLEGQASYYYWGQIFSGLIAFSRDRKGEPPNNLLNYGYAILRAVAARSLVGSGLLPTLGIHHSNRYNAYCLADDIMEPYRPYVDEIVYNIVKSGKEWQELTPVIKKHLLQICSIDIYFEGERSPLMVGMQRTTASLSQCFEGEKRKISYPDLR